MKEATGELSMTVVTIIAIVAIAGIVAFLAPKVKGYIDKTWTGLSASCPAGSHYDDGVCKADSGVQVQVE